MQVIINVIIKTTRIICDDAIISEKSFMFANCKTVDIIKLIIELKAINVYAFTYLFFCTLLT